MRLPGGVPLSWHLGLGRGIGFIFWGSAIPLCHVTGDEAYAALALRAAAGVAAGRGVSVVLGVSVVDVSDGTAGGTTLENGGRLTPYVFVPQSGSLARVLSTESIAVSDALQVAFTKLPVGTQFVWIA